MLSLGFVRALQVILIISVTLRIPCNLKPTLHMTYALWALLGLSGLLLVGESASLFSQARSVSPTDMQRLALLLSINTVIGPLAEEIFFRGVLYGFMRSKWNVITAAIISSFLFALAHIPNAASAALPIAFLGSFVMTLIYERTHSLTLCAALHMLFNFIMIVAFA